ncbi:Glutamyl-tRNA(Gln) amidotransferase subunit A [Piscirickettsia salmonis]|uniref:Glutamyl-tRNA(Gln) amidotransferase subunit A n=1 Tax=Piscirickettsia salmonis TaxID=1238 RepID=A0A1L6T9N2_PISSA|nr:Asp-tRNA(Asn)/Glu-tRNA(Gln) amidotransferase subunit GatA [Piscirickettsia salmonis]AKP73195.1 glutamyl-tRNA amidotransferase [Piscirickettsia salmonis LF-89 = ATCC VR-1361]ALB21879.1 aspartyl/glutamyl-tRNA(Asn/Gln) amidotransferase, A subunit [Piscirickettsia salmonis]AMA41567.1 glutamyl-tRNA amidotransferase [Piscirickettsia salmonis]AOS34053.1 glutamyl-tRNA amidotransferase [Piscirickettsia salmonis]APS61455.1 glutamyl-tRNA amidotransferase [Piscirickettsia salmonis]
MSGHTLAEHIQALKSKTISSLELTQSYIDQIKATDQTLNNFITLTEDHALQTAKQADEKLAKDSDLSPLTGVPIAYKDIFCTDGIKTSCGSKMLDNFIAPYDATVVTQLKNAGTVMLGKTNMDEFAMGSSNETSFYGTSKNPWDTNKVPGGSSGGSASAVAARQTPAALGTDTGGSIRQPASLCGITGLKPTYGRISRFGMIAYASSLDQAGPMTHTAEDAAIMLNAMAGFDPKDSTSVDHPVEDYTKNLNQSLEGIRIGLPKEYFSDGLDSQVEKQIQLAIAEYEKLGAKICEVSLPTTQFAVPAYYVIAPAECSSNLARMDGVRFGHRAEHPADLIDLYKRSRAEGFSDEVKRRIMIGTYALSAGYYDAYYNKAQQVRQLISDDFKRVFNEVDIIAGPTAPTTAFDFGSKKDPVTMYLSDIYTIAVNLAGLPGLSHPAGFVNQLPVGLQLIGKHFDESRLLNLAHRYQQVTDHHTVMPTAFKPV